MNDNDLRALAAKLLKHYVADQNPVAEALVAQIPLNRLPAKVIPLITAEQRSLLDMLGGEWADIHENKNVALIAQGCGGCGGCGGGGGDGGGSDGGGGGEGGGSGGEGGGSGGGSGGGFGGSDAGADGGDGQGGLGGSMGGLGDDSNSTSDSMQGVADSQADAPSAAVGDVGISADQVAAQQGFDPSAVASMQEEAQTTASPEDQDMQATTPDVEITSSISPATQAMLDAFNASQAQQSAPEQATTTTSAPETSSTTSSALGAIGSALSDAFSISQANAAPASPSTSGVADIMDAANAAAQQGQLNSFLADNNTAAQVLSAYPGEFANMQTMNNSMLEAQGQQAVFGSQTGQTVVGSPTGGATLGDWHGAAPSTATATNPYGSLTMSPQQAQQAELVGALAAIGSNQAAGTSAVQSTPTDLSLAITDPGSQLGSFVGPGGFTTAGPSSTGNPYQGTTAVGPYSPVGLDINGAPQGSNAFQGTGTSEASPTTSLTVSKGFDNPTVLPSGVDTSSQTTSLTVNKGPTTPEPTKSVDTSNTVTMPTVLPYVDGSSGTDTSTSGATDAGTTTPTTTPTTTSTTTTPLSAQEAILRKYLGTGLNLYRYGMGPERTYYSAEGGYFDADQYFADGGLVQPLSAPTVPLVSAQPTMAFTDGAGAVGSIAQPPGLTQSDSYGFDASTASPMAPSVAAAVPSMQPGLATLATPNVNASPTPSPIAQNPNVGYANGSSPLSNLTRS